MPAFPRSIHRRHAFHVAAALGFAASLAPIFTGCGEPPPLIPRGAWSLAFVDIPGCGPGAENQAVGIVTANARNELKDDGVEEVKVSCKVIDTGSGFEIQASESTKGLSLTLSIPNLAADATEANPTLGTVSYASPNTAVAFTSPKCEFYFVPQTDQGVSAGQVWLTFRCEEISAGIDNVCAIDIGYAAFENCRSQDDE